MSMSLFSGLTIKTTILLESNCSCTTQIIDAFWPRSICWSVPPPVHTEPKCYPLGVEIYKLSDPNLLEAMVWKPSPINGYAGNHGM